MMPKFVVPARGDDGEERLGVVVLEGPSQVGAGQPPPVVGVAPPTSSASMTSQADWIDEWAP